MAPAARPHQNRLICLSTAKGLRTTETLWFEQWDDSRAPLLVHATAAGLTGP